MFRLLILSQLGARFGSGELSTLSADGSVEVWSILGEFECRKPLPLGRTCLAISWTQGTLSNAGACQTLDEDLEHLRQGQWARVLCFVLCCCC